MTDDRAEAARPRPRRDGALRTPLWEALQYCHDAAIRLAEQLAAVVDGKHSEHIFRSAVIVHVTLHPRGIRLA